MFRWHSKCHFLLINSFFENIFLRKTNETSSSTQSSNSPGSSSSTTSRESANVFKFRTLLSSPSGSQVFRIVFNFPAVDSG